VRFTLCCRLDALLSLVAASARFRANRGAFPGRKTVTVLWQRMEAAENRPSEGAMAASIPILLGNLVRPKALGNPHLRGQGGLQHVGAVSH